MSRVNERQDKQRVESERMQKKSDKEARANKDTQKSQQFGNLVRQQGKSAQTQQEQGSLAQKIAQHQEKAQQGAGKAKGENARLAQLARGGTDHSARLMRQTEGFQGALKRAGQDTNEAKEGRAEAKEEHAVEGRVSSGDRVSDIEQKTENKIEQANEEAKAEATDKAKANAAIDTSGGGGSNDGDGDEPRKDASHVGAKGQANAAAQAEGAKKANAPRLPDEVLEKLVSEVWHGITAEGKHEFHIELKSGALAGAKLKVSSENGKVALSFSGLDRDTERLLSASEGELMRRFESKGMALDSLSFSSS